MGLPADTPSITLVDSLVVPDDSGASVGPGELLPVAAAAARLRAAERNLTFTRASRFAPSVVFGVDKGDSGAADANQLLPVIGFIAVPALQSEWGCGDAGDRGARSGAGGARPDAARDRRRGGAGAARAHRGAGPRTPFGGLGHERRPDRGYVPAGLWGGRRGARKRPEAQRNAREISRVTSTTWRRRCSRTHLRWLTLRADQP